MVETPLDSLPGKNRYPQIPGHGPKAGLMPTPSSIQSMLKNTTEIGDIGHVARQSRSPRKLRTNGIASHPTQRTLPARQLGLERRHRGIVHGGPPSSDDTLYSATHSQPGTVSGASSIYSMYRNRSETSFRSQSRAQSRVPSRGPSRGPESAHEPSHFDIYPSSRDLSLVGHRFYPNPQLRSQIATDRTRPRSPLAYPARLKRPGYRPSSPALSEVYRSASRSPYGSPSVSTNPVLSLRTVSPLSTSSITVSRCVWRQRPKDSDLVLGGQPLSPSNRYRDSHEYQNLHHGRIFRSEETLAAPTLVLPELYRSIDSISTVKTSSPPLFYDYSEDFQQESVRGSKLAPISRAAPGQAEKTSRRSVHEAKAGRGGSFQPLIAELPAEVPALRRHSASGTNSTDAELDVRGHRELLPKRISHTYSGQEAASCSDTSTFERASHASKESSLIRPTRETAAIHSSGVAQDGSIDIRAKTESSSGASKADTEQRSPSSSQTQADKSSTKDRTGYRILSSYKRSQEFLAGGSNRILGNANISLYSKRDCSSVSSAGSAAGQGTHEPDNDPVFSWTSSKINGNTSLPATLPKPSSVALETVMVQPAEVEIHSPIPKRSSSAPSNRERFSNILCIDEVLPEVDDFAESSTRQVRASGISNFIEKGNSQSKSDQSHQTTTSDYSQPTLGENLEIQVPKSGHGDHGSQSEAISNHVFLGNEYNRQRTSPVAERELKHISNAGGLSNPALSDKVSKESKLAINVCNMLPKARNGSIVDQKPAFRSTGTEDGRKLDTMKELPLRPRSSVVSFAPPYRHDSVALPFSFTPLRPEERDHETDSVAELGKLAASYLSQTGSFNSEPASTSPKLRPKSSSERTSLVSSLRLKSEQSGPEHTCAKPSPERQPTTITQAEELVDSASSHMPRFKIKIHRVSSSPARAVKITKLRSSAEASTRPSKESSTTVRCPYSYMLFPSLIFVNSAAAREYLRWDETILQEV